MRRSRRVGLPGLPWRRSTCAMNVKCAVDLLGRRRPGQGPLISVANAAGIVQVGSREQVLGHGARVLQHHRAIHHKQRLRRDHGGGYGRPWMWQGPAYRKPETLRTSNCAPPGCTPPCDCGRNRCRRASRCRSHTGDLCRPSAMPPCARSKSPETAMMASRIGSASRRCRFTRHNSVFSGSTSAECSSYLVLI